MKLSVAIITFNEEINIGRCLDSVLDIADEIVIIDSYSTDRTREICEKYPLRFILNPFDGHIEQKNFALSQCQFDYVLSLDADEEISLPLQNEIQQIKQKNLTGNYRMNRMTNYCGKWIKHGAWYPDCKLRLVNRHEALWQGINPHDELKISGIQGSSKLKGDILHYSFPTFSDHLQKAEKYSTIQAEAMFKLGKNAGILAIICKPVIRFIRDYIIRLGFMDAYAGYRIATVTSWTTRLKYMKLYDLSKSVK
ncbi:MAG: glycosyltransferase family 2 protein [Bacteroidales bacterium]|jgi:glycosyltransferase involved in cell wall biosynthesis|nr:glycosyltransferase family 2 protein [Bacteroidales bacterium]